jgi:hypothetical protein
MERDLGVVTAPSGTILIVDPGYLNLWHEDRPPRMPDGILSTPEATEAANCAVDLEIVGADAELAGRELNRQWNHRFLFDIPRSGIDEAVERVAQIAKVKRLDASLRVLPTRVTHRQRIGLALEAGGGAGEVQFHGIWTAVLSGLPAGEHRVRGEPMPDDHVEAGRLKRICVCVREGDAARSERFAYTMVDWARLLLIDSAALASWKAEEPLDGRADFVFWGEDADAVARRLSAPRLDDEHFGWRDLPAEEAAVRGAAVKRARDDAGAKFATDFRPHSHHHQLMEQVRASATGSGTVRLSGALACGFMTTWGDGIFEMHRDLDASGRLLRLRIELGTEDRVALMAKLRLRWWTSALVSRKVIDDGLPVRFMYREAADREQDSGWRMFSGYEDDDYNEDPKNIAIVRLSEFGDRDKRVDALLDEPVGSVFERRPEHDEFERVTDWIPSED